MTQELNTDNAAGFQRGKGSPARRTLINTLFLPRCPSRRMTGRKEHGRLVVEKAEVGGLHSPGPCAPAWSLPRAGLWAPPAPPAGSLSLSFTCPSTQASAPTSSRLPWAPWVSSLRRGPRSHPFHAAVLLSCCSPAGTGVSAARGPLLWKVPPPPREQHPCLRCGAGAGRGPAHCSVPGLRVAQPLLDAPSPEPAPHQALDTGNSERTNKLDLRGQCLGAWREPPPQSKNQPLLFPLLRQRNHQQNTTAASVS